MEHFAYWLVKNNLVDHFKNYPKDRNKLFKEFQNNTALEDPDSFLEWVALNPELAEKEYPHLMKDFTNSMKNTDLYFKALMIQKMPEYFPQRKAEVEKFFGIKKRRMIQDNIDFITKVLFEYEYPSETEKQTVESVRDELLEQKQYWEYELTVEKRLGTVKNQALQEGNNRLKVKQIALIHVYEGHQITRSNASEIASKYGYNSKLSGEGLFHDFDKYFSQANRTGDPGTRQKLKNQIKLIESIIEHLTGKSKDRAIDEIKLLKTLLEKNY